MKANLKLVVLLMSAVVFFACSKDNDEIIKKPEQPKKNTATLFVTLKGRTNYSDIFVTFHRDGSYQEKMHSAGVLNFEVSKFIGKSLTLKVGIKKGDKIKYFQGIEKTITIQKGKNILIFNVPKKEKPDNDTAAVPVAGFTYNQYSERIPSKVTFHNTSKNAVSYKWTIGSYTYTTKTPKSITYTAARKYAVVLTVTGRNGKTDTHTEYITVKEELTPKAGFTFTQNKNFAPITVQFENNSINATSYEWDFGDNTTSTLKNPSKYYTKSGIYTVRLRVKNYKKTHTYTSKINIARPTRLKIKKIVLLDYPLTKKDESGWDHWGAGRADIYWELTDKNNNFYEKGNIKEDIKKSDLPYTYTQNLPYVLTINEPNRKYDVTFYDYDSTSEDDYMGGGYFIPATSYNYNVLNWTLDNGLKFKLYVEWLK